MSNIAPSRCNTQSHHLWWWSIYSRIAEIRRALADDANEPRFIETATGKGYRFVARVVGSET